MILTHGKGFIGLFSKNETGMVMQIVEITLKLPYEERGKILSKIYEKVRGRIRDVHFFPPSSSGLSEITLELVVNDVQRLVKELKESIKNGKISVKVLSA
jgi:hypothetical protein